MVRYSYGKMGYYDKWRYKATLSLIKLDVLDTFKEIKIGVAYKINGKEICGFPSSLEKLADVEVEYEVFDGWMMLNH